VRKNAALLWRRILTADPEAIFGNQSARLLKRNPTDRLPQPGYIGGRYRARGLVFVSMNPGGGPQAGQNAADKCQYHALEQLRDVDEASVRISFDKLTGVLADIMPGWDIYQNIVVPVLKGLELDFSQVAYVNLLKWRTKPKVSLARLYTLSWDHHTREQLDLLAPSHVIALGKSVGEAFKRHYAGAAKLHFIPRRYSYALGGQAAIEGIVAAIKREPEDH
jgi:hypothetical protein